jgi:Ca2+-binding RTX toxin-like protein
MAMSDIRSSVELGLNDNEEDIGSFPDLSVSNEFAPHYVLSAAILGQTRAGSSSMLDASVTPAATADIPANPAFLGSNDLATLVGPSGDLRVDASLRGAKWSDGSITYSNPDGPDDYQAGYSIDVNADGLSAQNQGFSQLTAQQMVAVHFALDATFHTQPGGAAGFSVEGFTNLDIDYAGPGVGTGTLRIANTADASTAYAFYPGMSQSAGDAWLGPSIANPVAGNYAWYGVLHELGHSLGLKHGHEAFGSGSLPADVNSLEFSLMTYAAYIGQSPVGRLTFERWGAPQTYMMLDIAALQHLYGADYTVNSTDTVYTWNPASGATFVNANLAIQPGGNRIFETIWDGGGTDTYDLSNYTTNLTVDLGPGDYSIFSTSQLANLGGGPNGGFARGNVFNALQWNNDTRSLIENAIGGAGADLLRGNAAANRMTGNAGNDTLYGEDGNDVLDGGSGADWLYGDAGDDMFFYDAGDAGLAGGRGTDTLVIAQSGVTVDLTAVRDDLIGDVEVIDLGGRGNTLVLGSGDVLALSSTTDIVRIDGGAGDKVVSANGRTWVRAGEEAIGPNVYHAYTQGGATLLIYRDIAAEMATTFPIQRGDPSWTLLDARGDFNGDGKSDLLWRGPNTEVRSWLISDSTVLNEVSHGPVPLSWSIVDAHGDYNADGRNDVLWRNSDGMIATWLMNGNAPHVFGLISPMTTSWTVLSGHGDYNGDGKSDLLWRGPNGEVMSWLISDDTILSQVSHGPVPLSWSIVDTHGDYNADGRNDVLWRNSDGMIATWLMNGNARHVFGLITPMTTSWTLLDGHADYNGDGKSDLLWRGPNTEVRSWLINDSTVLSEVSHGPVPLSWSIVDTHGDYNADGRADVLWRNSDGMIATWLMNGNAPPVFGLISPMTTSWTLLDAHGDYNGDGKSDLLWRGPNGEFATWLIDGANLLAQPSHSMLPLERQLAAEAPGTALVGDVAANVLTGSAAADTLRGFAGADTLTGNGGGDRFVFETALNASTNVDTVRDFKSGQDTLLLSEVIFGSLARGTLPAGSLVAGAGARALDANDYILYDTATGRLSYDADASGPGLAVAFATLFGQPALSATDITVGVIG